MTDVASGPVVDATAAEISHDTSTELTAESAARLLAEQRWKKDNPAESAEADKPATAETELPEEGSAEPEEVLSEEAEPEVEENLPPIEPPASWTKAEKERFQSLPRETQEYLHTRESERDRAFLRSQNEIAEQRKAIQAERDAAAQVRQQYEAKLPSLLNELESVNQAQFGDIKTMDDVVKLQAEDPFRFQTWQVHQMRLQAAKVESDRVQQQTAYEKQTNRFKYETEQTAALKELVPEFTDAKKYAAAKERAIKLLTGDLGLKDDQLSRWYADDVGHEILSSAGIQKLIADGLQLRDILAAPKAVSAKPVPQVQKPGAAAPRGTQSSERIQALQKTFERDPSVENATALRLARLKRA